MYVGIDHSTTGVKTAILRDDGSVSKFTIDRTPSEDGEWSFLRRLSDHVDLDAIELVANGYSYGDDFSRIRDIESLDERGVVDHIGAGHGFGTGTKVFDELAESDLPVVMFPGVHNGLDTLHHYFQHYSVYSGADTVAMSRYAEQLLSEERGDSETFVATCVSSSSMATLVHDGVIKGGFHWLGLIHGHVDIELLRKIRDGEQEPNDVFMRSGLIYRSGKSFENIKGVPEEDLLECVYWATLQNVNALAPFANNIGDSTLDGVVLSGRLARVEEPIDMQTRLTSDLDHLAPVHVTPDFSTAVGAALIARDVCEGESDVLGIPVGPVPKQVQRARAR